MKTQKILLSLISFIFITLQSQAQAPTIEWQNTLGGSNTDKLYSICATDDGGSILGGYSFSGISGDKTEINQGGDYWIVKLSATGAIEWQNTIGGSLAERTFSTIRQTNEGGYIVGGTSESNISGDKTQICRGAKDYWIVKLDATGNIEWNRTLGGPDFDYLNCLIQTSDGGYMAGGTSYSGISPDKTQPVMGLSDYWIVKLNASGAIEWDKTIGGNGADALNSMAQTTDTGYILGGYSSSGISGDKTEDNLGSGDMWVIKLSASGTIEWQNTIGGESEESVKEIHQTDEGSFIIGGSSSSGVSADKTEPNIGESDYWILKLDAAGNIEWQNTIGGAQDDNLASLIKTSDGGYLAGGYSLSGISVDKTEQHYGNSIKYDYWLVKLNAAGNIDWQNTIAGKGDDVLTRLAESADGGYLIGGFSNSPMSFDKTENNTGDYDYWVVKLSGISCSVPSSLVTDHITAASAKIHWTVSAPAEKFIVNYREDDDALPWIQLPATTNSKNLNSLLPATTYQFRVRSKCGTELTAFSPVSYFTTSPLKESGGISHAVNVYPNPADDKITINLQAFAVKNTFVQISNMSGTVIRTYYLTGEFTDIDISDYATGMYIVQLQNENQHTVQKFVKN